MCCGGHPSPGAPVQPTPCLSPLAALPSSEISLCDLDHVSMVVEYENAVNVSKPETQPWSIPTAQSDKVISATHHATSVWHHVSIPNMDIGKLYAQAPRLAQSSLVIMKMITTIQMYDYFPQFLLPLLPPMHTGGREGTDWWLVANGKCLKERLD